MKQQASLMRNTKQANSNCLYQKRRPVWKHARISAIGAAGNLAVLNVHNIVLRGISAWCKKDGFFVVVCL